MKNFILLVFMAISFVNYGQQGTTITDSIMHDGAYRSYIIYIPASYNANSAAPLVFNFHGRGSNAIQQYYYGDFRGIADTAFWTTDATVSSVQLVWNRKFWRQISSELLLPEITLALDAIFKIRLYSE